MSILFEAYTFWRIIGLSLYKKRSRARVTLGGQCLLLQISLQIKMFKILKKKPKYPYESHLARHTAEPLKKIVKILETRPQSSKKCPKINKNYLNS